MTSIGVYSNQDKCEDRREDDFYPTPWQPTEAFILAEHEHICKHRVFWEPACGDGGIAKVMEMHGYSVIGTDLVFRGYGDGGRDFLHESEPLSSAIITNPPFNIAESFIRKAMSFEPKYMALLLKADYFHAQGRVKLFRQFRPARIYPIGWRVDFTGGGSNHFECSWFVWDVLHKGVTHYMFPLERPEILGQKAML